MKTDTKEFDCVEMMHRGALRIYEETKDMTLSEELAYWDERHAQAMEALKPVRKAPPAGE